MSGDAGNDLPVYGYYYAGGVAPRCIPTRLSYIALDDLPVGHAIAEGIGPLSYDRSLQHSKFGSDFPGSGVGQCRISMDWPHEYPSSRQAN